MKKDVLFFHMESLWYGYMRRDLSLLFAFRSHPMPLASRITQEQLTHTQAERALERLRVAHSELPYDILRQAFARQAPARSVDWHRTPFATDESRLWVNGFVAFGIRWQASGTFL